MSYAAATEQAIGCAPAAPMPPCDDDQTFSDDSCSDGDDMKAKLGNLGGDMCNSLSDDECSTDSFVDTMPVCKQPAPQPVCEKRERFCADQMPAATAAATIGSPLPPAAAPVAGAMGAAAAEELAAERRERHARKKAARAAAAEAAAAAASVSGGASSAQQEDKTVRVQMRVEISASLNDLARDPSRGTWAMKPSQMHVFQKAVRVEGVSGAAPTTKYVGDPAKAIVERVEVTKVSNNFPTNIGFVASEVPGELALADGTKLLYAADSEEHSNVNVVVYNAPNKSHGAHMDTYSAFTPAELRSAFTGYPGEPEYSVLAKGSQMARLFELNQKHAEFAEAYKEKVDMGTEALKVRTAAIESLYNKTCEMIKNLPHTNLHNFAVRIVRTDGRAWTDAEGIEAGLFSSAESMAQTLARRYTVSLHLTMTHVLPTIGAGNKK